MKQIISTVSLWCVLSSFSQTFNDVTLGYDNVVTVYSMTELRSLEFLLSLSTDTNNVLIFDRGPVFWNKSIESHYYEILGGEDVDICSKQQEAIYKLFHSDQVFGTSFQSEEWFFDEYYLEKFNKEAFHK